MHKVLHYFGFWKCRLAVRSAKKFTVPGLPCCRAPGHQTTRVGVMLEAYFYKHLQRELLCLKWIRHFKINPQKSENSVYKNVLESLPPHKKRQDGVENIMPPAPSPASRVLELEAATVTAAVSAQIKEEKENPKPGLWVTRLYCAAK